MALKTRRSFIMMRSLFSGVSGLRTHQTRMDVIGNNIANVNTTAYKSMSINFADLMYQTTQAASGPNAETGTAGTNPKQIGLGVQTAAISTNITEEGATQSTGNPFDLKISGDEFFVVSNGTNTFFTRDGSFYVDAAGNLAMSSTGYNVMGWQTDENGNVKKDLVSPIKVMDANSQTYPAEYTQAAHASGIIDYNDTDQGTTNGNGKMLNLSIYDNLGYSYTVKLSLKNVQKGVNAQTPYKFTTKVTDIVDSNGDSILGKDASGNIDLSKISYTGSTTTGGTTNEFAISYSAEKGAYVGTETAKLNLSGLGDAFTTIDVDFSKAVVSDNKGKSTIGLDKGSVEGKQTGRALGTLQGVSIQTNGMIYASYSNNQQRCLGQIAVAEFANASGLQKEGDNLYSATQNSGEFNGMGIDITTNGDKMNTGVLEMSNVDLSSQFTDMITTQRGFQANSRTITVSDTLLEELINLKR